MSTTFEKYAQELALAATTGERAPLVRVAQPFTKAANVDLAALLKDPTVQRYLLGGLGGAGLGALIGSMQPQKKKRNALLYGLMGGAGGLGLAHLFGQMPGTAVGDPNKPVSSQSVADIRAAAQAAGMSPQEYLKQQGAQESNKAFRESLLVDGGTADRVAGSATGYVAGKATQRTYNAARNRVLGTRDANGKIVPPQSPVERARAARQELRANKKLTSDARDNQSRLVQNKFDQAQSATQQAEQTARKDFRRSLDVENARLKQEIAELARSNKAMPVDLLNETTDPGYRQRQLQAQEQAARAASRNTKKTIAQGHRPELQTLADARRGAATSFASDMDQINTNYNNRRTAHLTAARDQIGAARPRGGNFLPNSVSVPTGRGALAGPKLQMTRIPLRSPMGKIFSFGAKFAPVAYGAIRGVSGASQDANNVATGAGNVLDYFYGGGGSK